MPDTGSQATEATGGPDAFGYTYYDQDEAECSFDWVDISATGTSRISKTQLVELADAVEHPSARGRIAFKFLLQSRHGNVDSLKRKNAKFRRDLPEMVAVENCLNGYPLRGRVGFMLNISPTVAFREVGILMWKKLAMLEL